MSDLQVAVVHVDDNGNIQSVTHEDFDTFSARGRVEDCDCEFITCVCTEARKHKTDCFLRLAMTCPIPIECGKHGVDVCPTCDPCTCEGPDLPPGSS